MRRTIPSRPLLIGYWGQNGAGLSVGAANYERPLSWFCQNSKYDIINLAFLVTFFDPRNAGKYRQFKNFLALFGCFIS